MMTDNIGFALQMVAREQPNTTAIVELNRFKDDAFEFAAFSYAELEQMCDEYTRGLYDFGIRSGDRVAMLVPAGARLYALTFALFRLGAVVVFVDPGIGIRRMGKCLNDARPKYFIGVLKAQIARLLLGWGRRTIKRSILVGPSWLAPRHNLAFIRERGRSASVRTLGAVGGEDVAAILFTSGSTGPPKGVVYSHSMFVNQVRMIRRAYDILPGEVDLPTFPLFGLFDPALGMTTVVPDMDPTRPAQADPRRLIAAIRQFSVTNLFGSPALLNTLTRFTKANEVRLHTLKRVLSAGAPVGRKVIEGVHQMLPDGADLHTPYGATECLPVASISGRELLDTEIDERNGAGGGVCVGRPLSENTLKIVSVSDEVMESVTEKTELEKMCIGEVMVLGPTTSQDYFERPAATAHAKVQSETEGRMYHRMGDLGYLDTEGRLWFCGRKAHRISRSEGFLCAVPMEQIINRHPSVFRTAVVANASGMVTALVELEPGYTFDRELEQALMHLCSQYEATMCISEIRVHPGFPVDIRHNAKIDRAELTEWLHRRST